MIQSPIKITVSPIFISLVLVYSHHKPRLSLGVTSITKTSVVNQNPKSLISLRYFEIHLILLKLFKVLLKTAHRVLGVDSIGISKGKSVMFSNPLQNWCLHQQLLLLNYPKCKLLDALQRLALSVHN